MPQFIDLEELANNPNMNLSIISNQEENPQDAFIRRFKDITLFCTTILLILSVLGFCAYLLLSNTTSLDDKKWATAIASSLISAFIAYLTGKNINSKF